MYIHVHVCMYIMVKEGIYMYGSTLVIRCYDVPGTCTVYYYTDHYHCRPVYT